LISVIFDISVLGIGHFNERGRTGVFRVTESLAYHLNKEADCDLLFASTYSLRVMAQTKAYLKSNANFQKIPFLTTDSPAIDKLCQKLHTLYFAPFFKHGKRVFQFISSSAFKALNQFFYPINSKAIDKADVFHSPFFPLPQKNKNYKTAKRFLTVHDFIPVLFPHFFSFRETRMLRKTLNSLYPDDWVFAVSQSTKNDLCSFFSIDPARVFVTYPAASEHFKPCHDTEYIDMVRKKYNIPEEPYFLSLGTLEPRKNLAHTIECFAKVVEQEGLDDVNLVVVGTKGWQHDSIFEAIALNPAVKKRIVFTGYVEDEELPALYSSALGFVYPSLYEGFGLPPLEAMQCGAPVIVSDTSSLPEVAGNAGIMVSPKDKDALCQAILELYQKTDLRKNLKARGLEQARQFSWTRCAQETIDAYKQAIAS
jgi:glycosyltransferase involved in cell wall biosynthesis